MKLRFILLLLLTHIRYSAGLRGGLRVGAGETAGVYRCDPMRAGVTRVHLGVSLCPIRIWANCNGGANWEEHIDDPTPECWICVMHCKFPPAHALSLWFCSRRVRANTLESRLSIESPSPFESVPGGPALVWTAPKRVRTGGRRMLCNRLVRSSPGLGYIGAVVSPVSTLRTLWRLLWLSLTAPSWRRTHSSPFGGARAQISRLEEFFQASSSD